MLAFALPETISEGPWGKTLYGISHCHQLPKPLPLGALRKAEGGNSLSDDFAYSYAIVRELEPNSVEVYPEEIAEPAQYFEGALGKVTVNAYERNPDARRECVNHHGTSCAVCGFNFGATYGDIGSGFIHVHHLKPLGSIKKGYHVDPINDLRPVCPNCHAMLHKRNPPYSVDELTAAIKTKCDNGRQTPVF